MNPIDENAQVGIELTTTGLRFTAKALIAIMELFLNREDKKEFYQDLKSKQGKQKLKNLFEKKENIGIESLENNLSKQELIQTQKELKSMGVDFSIQKVNKDEYSLFFAGQDREVIEKGMKNCISKYVKRQKIKEDKQENKNEISNENKQEINKDISKQNNNINQNVKKTKKENSKENKTKPTFSVATLQKQAKEKRELKKEEKVITRKPSRTR